MYQSTKLHPPRKSSKDRFIPLRMAINMSLLDAEASSFLKLDPAKDVDFLNYAKVRRNHENYKRALRTALIPVETRVLNFFTPRHHLQEEVLGCETWPVKARKRPVIGPPSTTLDMPEFDSNPDHHVTEWSKNNCLATIFQGEVHMWWTHSDSLRMTTETGGTVRNCIKWRERDEVFAVGLVPNRVTVWDVKVKKFIHESRCCVYPCEVLCLEWVGAHLITGCSFGLLKMYTVDLKCVHTQRTVHQHAIINMVVSCNGELLVTSSKDKTVIIWKVPALEVHLLLKFHSVITALAWHPWKHSLLALGLNLNESSTVTIFNVNNRKQIAREKTTYCNSSINCLTFNPISAELVVSYCVTDRTGDQCGIVAVLSNINEVVEELHLHKGPVPYLLWGNGGKTLASVSADENLCMWNFFGCSLKDQAEKAERKSADFTAIRCHIR